MEGKFNALFIVYIHGLINDCSMLKLMVLEFVEFERFGHCRYARWLFQYRCL